MSKKQLDTIFDSSSTTDISETLARGGGLGLVLCQHYVSQLGGELHIESLQGKGTSVQIHLPAQHSNFNSVRPDSVSTTSQAHYQPALRPRTTKFRVLIVDDNEDHRHLLEGILDHLDVDVLQALDGSQGVSLWQKFRPELIFMDIRMSGLDGGSATQKIRQQQSESNDTPCRIVAISADENNQKKHDLIRSGFDAFLSKPFKAEDIHRILFDLGIVDTQRQQQRLNLWE